MTKLQHSLNETEPLLDVCIVTKDESKISPAFRKMMDDSGIPKNRIIIENSRPLGLAREKAIHRVKTDSFVWLDDDVWLPNNWYNTIMKYWRPSVGWIEGLALPTRPKWYADWANYNYLKRRSGIQILRTNQRSFNCCAVVKTKALSDWHYPSEKYLGFGSEDLFMSNHVTKKGYARLRVPVVAYHAISYSNSIWPHISSGTKSLGALEEYHKVSLGMKYAASCFGSGLFAALHTGNALILPNALHWSWCWFRDMAL